MSEEWTPQSWRSKPIAQDVKYTDQEQLEKVLGKIKTLPPLVTPSEIERLRYQLAQVQQNKAFLLHAGDCAESFDACTHENICNKIGLILSFSLILIWGARLPVVRIGRIAGQYAKPRSSGTEIVNGKEVMSFRGDNVNGLSPDDRTPNPDRLLSAYFHSSTTLNYLRSLLSSGFADLHHPRDWSLSHVRSPTLRQEFESISEGLADALDFSRTIGAESSKPFEKGGSKGVLGEVDFYTSHEGLLLPYEEALTRLLPIPPSILTSSTSSSSPSSPSSASPGSSNSIPPLQQTHYNTSAHFIWLGDRTRQLTNAHIEYFRGIRNPIGVKVGPSMKEDELVRLLDIVNPDKEPGRVTLITRYGADKIASHLATHIRAIQNTTHPVAWLCDPMHGNTHTASNPPFLKTRHFSAIIHELTECLRIHEECNSTLNGVSLEFTGELDAQGFSVTECLGGSMELKEEELGLRYQSFCDPRLNFEQSLDVAFLLSNHFKNKRRAGRQEQAKDVLLSELGKKKA